MKELIHFAHGNGFPALCYRQMLDELGHHFQYSYIDRIGHNKKFPVSENWHYLVDEVVASIKSKTDQPVIGLGHSMGGILTFLASIEKPQLFKAVIMLDSPILGPIKSGAIRVAKALGIIDRVTPAIRTLGRQHYWENEEKLSAYLQGRSLFKYFDHEALKDYIHYGMEKKDDGYYLRFNKHIEYSIYHTLPHSLTDYKGMLKVPTMLIYGKKSSVVYGMDIRYMKRAYGIEPYAVPGSHMFPMEYPKLTANKILELIKEC